MFLTFVCLLRVFLKLIRCLFKFELLFNLKDKKDVYVCCTVKTFLQIGSRIFFIFANRK